MASTRRRGAHTCQHGDGRIAALDHDQPGEEGTPLHLVLPQESCCRLLRVPLKVNPACCAMRLHQQPVRPGHVPVPHRLPGSPRMRMCVAAIPKPARASQRMERAMTI